MFQKFSHNSNYTYDADGERIVRYVPGRLDGFYSAHQAGHNERLERFIYPSGLLTVKTLPEENHRRKQIATYTKHYYIGAERISGVIGRGNGIGQNLLGPCHSFPSTQDIFMMNNEKVQEAEDALQDDYQFFEKQLTISESFFNRPGCFAMGYTGEHNTYWFHPDHLGSSSYISNKDGEISQHLEYFPFGETLVEEHKNSNNSPYKFNAKELDAETGNYYYGARYYNPKFSIWLSVDPLAEKYPGWSPYNYTLQNPVVFVDPDGRSVEENDDIIFRNNRKEELGRIVIPGEPIYVDIDTDLTVQDLVEIDPLKTAEKLGIKNPDAVGISFEYSGVVGGGLTGGFDFVFMLEGEEEGDLFGFSKIGGAVGAEGQIEAIGVVYTFNKESDSKHFNAKGLENNYNGYSFGVGVSYSYSWSNEDNKPQIYPGGFGSNKSTVTWKSRSLGKGIGGRLGAKYFSGNSTLMNNGKPIYSVKNCIK